MQTKARVCMGQFAPDINKAGNLELIAELMAEASRFDADLLVLPEDAMLSAPKLTLQEKQAGAETLEGEFVTTLKRMAAENHIALIAGMQQKVDDSRPANSILYIDAQGDLVSHYHKLHLYDAFGYKESDTVKPGNDFTPLVFELEGIRFGVMTCYDLRFPEMARCLVDNGADVLLVPAAWFAGSLKESHWQTLLRARAIENTVYVIGVGQTRPTCTGLSMAIDPMGLVIANAGEMPGVKAVDIDMTRIDAVREVNPSLINRRFKVVPA